MAIQYSISYDDKGSPSLVKNTIEGSKPVIKSSFNIGEYKPVRTVRTDFDFDNITEQEAETVYESLQNYIYKNDNNRDDRPELSEQEKFLKQSFEAAAARDPEGNIIGGLTFAERLKMGAVQTYLAKEEGGVGYTVASNIPIVGSIVKGLAHAGSNYIDPYYDPVHASYYTEGFGQYTDKLDRPGLTKDQQIDKLEKAGIDSGTGVEDPSDYLQRVNEKQRRKDFADIQNSIGKSLHGGGNGGGNQGQRDAGPGFSGGGTAAEMGSF